MDEYGIYINVKKTKTTVTSKKRRRILEILHNQRGNIVEQIQQFKYLGSITTTECWRQKRYRYSHMAKQVYNNWRFIITNSTG